MELILLIYDLNPIINEHFKYNIRIPMMLDFHQVRQWLSATYGYSDELNDDCPANKHWAFIIRLSSNIVYLKGEEEVAWFKIKYGETLL
jgi:hypothetical protein